MSKKNIFLVSAVVCGLAVLAGAVVVATWDVPRPTTQVEKVIPDERFPR
jgi:outer membrane murein-binding lipoprotein Lpp